MNEPLVSALISVVSNGRPTSGTIHVESILVVVSLFTTPNRTTVARVSAVINSSAVVTQLATTATPNLFSRNPVELVAVAAACPHSLTAFYFVETTVSKLSMWWCPIGFIYRAVPLMTTHPMFRLCSLRFFGGGGHADGEGNELLLALSATTVTPPSTLAAALLLLHRIQPCQAPRVRQWKIRERTASPPSLYQHTPFYLPSCNQPLAIQDGRGYWTQIATVLAAHHSFIHRHRISLNHRRCHCCFVRITIFCSRRRRTSYS